MNFLGVSQSAVKEYDDQLKAWKTDETNNTQPQIRVAKLHFPIQLVTRDTNQQWVTPLTKEEAEQLQCYKDRDPPAHLDCVMKYNPFLGDEGPVKINKK